MIENVTINGVASKDINTPNGPSTIYEIDLADGRQLTTFVYELALQAQAAIGQGLVQVDYTDKPKTTMGRDGRPRTFNNRYLNSVSSAQQTLMPAIPPMGQQPAIPMRGETDTARAAKLYTSIPIADPDPKGPEIRRSVGVKVAAQLLQYFERPEQTMDVFWLVADSVASYVEHGPGAETRPTFSSDPEAIDTYGQSHSDIPF